MSKTNVLQLRQELRGLPASTRALLAQDLLDSLELDSPDKSLDETWAELAERRLDEVLTGKVKTIRGDEVLETVRNRKH